MTGVGMNEEELFNFEVNWSDVDVDGKEIAE